MRSRTPWTVVALALPVAGLVALAVSRVALDADARAAIEAPPVTGTAPPEPPAPVGPRPEDWVPRPADAPVLVGEHPLHARLAIARDRYEAMLDEAWPTVPAPRGVLRPGATDPAVPALRERLRVEGFLTEVPETGHGWMVFDEAVEAALKRFQELDGLPADGRLGAATLEALNAPLIDRLGQLDRALEEAASMRPAHRQVVVNLPAFRLHGFEGDRETLTMRVIVGEHPRHRTPVLHDEIEHVVFRPVWNVPVSISAGEMGARALSNPAYLARRGYQLVDRNGRPVSPSAVSDAALRSGRVYVRQRPGPNNALGLVKFLFPNRWDVYLHDTPADHLFARERRDLSHGCVRVEEPEALAAWLLRDQGWDEARVKRAMHGGGGSQWVAVEPHVPVHLVYWTAWPEPDGSVRFLKDVYGAAVGP